MQLEYIFSELTKQNDFLRPVPYQNSASEIRIKRQVLLINLPMPKYLFKCQNARHTCKLG